MGSCVNVPAPGDVGPQVCAAPLLALSAVTKEYFATWGSQLVWWAQPLGRAGLCPGHRHPAQLNLQAQVTTEPRDGSQSREPRLLMPGHRHQGRWGVPQRRPGLTGPGEEGSSGQICWALVARGGTLTTRSRSARVPGARGGFPGPVCPARTPPPPGLAAEGAGATGYKLRRVPALWAQRPGECPGAPAQPFTQRPVGSHRPARPLLCPPPLPLTAPLCAPQLGRGPRG